LKAKLKPILIIGLLILILNQILIGQDNLSTAEEKLNDISSEIPALKKQIDISVTGVTIQEFLRGIANSSGLNINVDPSLNVEVINNFNNVKVIDILVFLIKQYNLELSIIGNIISISKGEQGQNNTNAIQNLQYDSLTNTINIDYQGQDLMIVAKEITLLTGKNIILSPGLEQVKINSFIQKMPLENALEKLAYANNLKMTKTEDNFFLLTKQDYEASRSDKILVDNRNRIHQVKIAKPDDNSFNLETKVLSGDSISVFANNAPIDEVIKEVTDKLGLNYFITSPLEGRTTLNIANASFPDLLKAVLNGTTSTYKKFKGIYLIGNNKTNEIKDFRVIQLQDRTVTKLLDVIPDGLKADLELKEFSDLNSLLVGGPSIRVDELEKFIQKIDKIVPVILIEVLIVNMNKSYTVSTGIEAGIAGQPVTTQGKVFPELDIQLGAQSINNLINNFNGFGSANIGKVNPNFYLSLKALESQGILKVYSTPKLSTLNGHEATMTIGSMEYYQEERTDIIGSQNPQTTTSKIYKSVNADLTVAIKPVVSGDNQITLEIEVNQSDFTERIEKLAPPGQVTRKFKSVIRVRNQEMVLLGGLEEKKMNDSSSGVPLISRIPILKWFFSSRNKINSSARLNIFIKPTIIN
jgi:type IV pilus assembly protein PilQ